MENALVASGAWSILWCALPPQLFVFLHSFVRHCPKFWLYYTVLPVPASKIGFLLVIESLDHLAFSMYTQGNFNVCNFFSFQMGYLGAFAKIKSITTIHCVIQVHLVLPTGVDTWRSALY